MVAGTHGQLLRFHRVSAVLGDPAAEFNVGFFLQTYAHVLRNDDRDAAQHAAAFLIGKAWSPVDEAES